MHELETSRFSDRNGFSEDLTGESTGCDMRVNPPKPCVLES